ncbi:MAG: PilZ domain-containing protein [Sphingorhabdus sp.]
MKSVRRKKSTRQPVREARQATLHVCQMGAADLPDQRVIISNISSSGMACRAVYPPNVGERVSIMLGPFGEVGALVRWIDRDRFGVSFDEEVDSIAIRFTKTGFRSADYDLPQSEAFDGILLTELFRKGDLG